MLHQDALGLLIGAVVLGAIHGIEPGHGWPVAAAYAIDKTNKWFHGFAASFTLGVGHLISSIAMVGVFFYAKSYLNLTQVNRPIELVEGIHIGGPISVVAGLLLIGLGAREYYGGHSHSHGSSKSSHSHDSHEHHDQEHEEHHTHESRGVLSRVKEFLPFVGRHSHSHGAENSTETADRGLFGIAWFAFILGFAHEEEFQIIGLCAGSNYCLELMTAYALAVIVALVSLTLLLVAGYQHYEDRVERYTPYLPLFSAVVLVTIGIGFITGVF